MTRDPRRFDAFMHRAFAPFRDVPREQVDAACDHVRRDLREGLEARPRFVETPPEAVLYDGRSRRVWLRSALAAATLMLIAAGIVSWRQFGSHDSLAVVEAGESSMYLVADGRARRLQPDEGVGLGDLVRSNGGSGGMLRLADGSRVEMRSNSELAIERATDGIRIRLDSGGIIVIAAEQRAGHLYVRTKDMTVSVVGTVFVVNADDDGSRVAVVEGEVRVQQGATDKKLRPGERVASSANNEQFSVASELAWSRRAAALMALLERQAAVAQASAVALQASKDQKVAFEVVSIRPSGPAVPAPGVRGGGGGGLNSRPAETGCVFDSFGYSYQLDPRRLAVIRTTLLHLAAYTIPLPLSVPERRPDVRCATLTEMGLLSGGPDWIRTDAWDVVAAIPEGVFALKPTLTDPTLQQMIRTMLVEKFGLVVRSERKELPVYLLKVGKGGPKFNGSIPLTSDRWGGSKVTIMRIGPDGNRVPVADLPPPPDGGITVFGGGSFAAFGLGSGHQPGQLSARNISMTNLANYMFGLDGRPVLDRTGLTGRHDFHYVEPGVEAALARVIKSIVVEGYDNGPEIGGPNPLIRPALKSVGLELEEARVPFDSWVIERAERPSEN